MQSMKVTVIGAGMMGSAAAWDLVRSGEDNEVTVADVSAEKLSLLKKKLGDRCTTTRTDVTKPENLRRLLKGRDVAISALPHGAAHPVDVAAVESGAKLVNIAFEDEQMELDRRAKERGAVLIPGCGVAPGLSSILVAEGSRRLDAAREGHIYVGGLPQEPRPPLSYHLVFSVKGLIREYLSARVIRDGRVVNVEPFAEVKRLEFPEPIGTLEAFHTDGLGSSIYSLSSLDRLDEWTLRYPGHAERVDFLVKAGFFSEDPVVVEGRSIAPIDASGAVLQRLLTGGDPRDVTVLRVVVVGLLGGRRTRVAFDLLDYYDEKNEITSMGRTTGFTAAIVARMLGGGEIEGTGVLPPETSLTQKNVSHLLEELSSRGVKVRRRSSSSIAE